MEQPPIAFFGIPKPQTASRSCPPPSDPHPSMAFRLPTRTWWLLPVMSLLAATSVSSPPQPVSETHFQDTIRPLLVKYCAECHSDEDASEGIAFLTDRTPQAVSENRAIWSSVAEQLINRTMPPADELQPKEEERIEAAHWIDRHLRSTACDLGPYAGAPVQRRLNREQYEYAIEDLTGLEFDFVESFPADSGGGEGFNNNGELLFLPPLLMERYLEVADQIVDRLVVVPTLDATFRPRVSRDGSARLVNQDSGMPFLLVPSSDDSVTEASLQWVVYEAGDYSLKTRFRSRSSDASRVRMDWNGKALETIETQGKVSVFEDVRNIRLTKGAHRFSFAAEQTSASIELIDVTVKKLGTIDKERLAATKRLLHSVGDQTHDGSSEIANKGSRDAARAALADFGRRAWRRTLTEAEIERLLALFTRGSSRGEPFEQALKLPLKAILVSPKFLFISESASASETDQPVSDLELASRLSFFLWNSLPDDQLISSAESNQLHRPRVLREQVRRMLNDPRSSRFARAFAGQWLGTEAVGRTKIPDTNFFRPPYSAELVRDLRRQVTETMTWMIRQDLPITDWLGAEETLLNKRLAEHYGMTPVPSSDEKFIPVAKSRSARSSVLGMGAVHMLTSYSRRTSPVLRGGWVLETLFGVHLPAPPPDAGDLPGGENENKKRTVRQRLEAHRENPTCAACHDLIDPIGFGLENFDVLGRFREKEGENAIDTAGRMPSGETFAGPDELREILLDRKDDFREQYCRKMLGFALARSLTDADACTINRLTEQLSRSDDRTVALIESIVFSHPFLHRKGSKP